MTSTLILSAKYHGSQFQFRCSVVSDSLWPHGLQHAILSCPSPTPGSYSNSRPWVGDDIQPPHPLLSPSTPALNLSQHKGLFQWVSSLHQAAKVLQLQLQHQFFQWVFRIPWLFLPCLCIPSLLWVATIWICSLELREGHGDWSLFPTNRKRDPEGLPSPGAPQGLAQFQVCGVIFYVATGNQKESIFFLRDGHFFLRMDFFWGGYSSTGQPAPWLDQEEVTFQGL